MARWEDALDAQVDTAVALATNDVVRGYTQGWAASNDSKSPLSGISVDPMGFANRLAAMAFNADTLTVDPDMMSVWEAMAASFEPEPLAPSDLITPNGFMWLPRPWYVVDMHGMRLSARAVMWHSQEFDFSLPREGALAGALGMGDELPRPVVVHDHDVTFPVEFDAGAAKAGGVMLTLFHDPRDEDERDRDLAREVGIDRAVPRMMGAHLMVDHVVPWAYKATFDESRLAPGTASVPRAVQALWRLMQQRIAVSDRVRPDRGTRRRMARLGLAERDITVVRLRRPEASESSDERRDVDWTHRWIVGGHWRWQPYASLGISRQIWIAPYVKGPEDKPLVVRKGRVFELVR